MFRPEKIKPLDGIIPQYTQYLGRFVNDPAPTEAGQWWYNTTEEAQKYFNGQIIKAIGTGIPSEPHSPPGVHITNIYWDRSTEEIVIQHE